MKRILVIAPWLLLLFLILSAESCDAPQQQAAPPTNCDASGNAHSTLRSYDYSPECDALAQIYDFRMKGGNTWTVFYSMGKPIFVCPSIGYPLPYTTQFTNPMQVISQGTSAAVAVPQAEPNGLFTGTSNATWVLCVRTLPGGGSQVVPVYSEPDVIVLPHPVTIGPDGSIQDAGGGSSVQINIKQK